MLFPRGGRIEEGIEDEGSRVGIFDDEAFEGAEAEAEGGGVGC